jgi:hypothetical protein
MDKNVLLAVAGIIEEVTVETGGGIEVTNRLLPTVLIKFSEEVGVKVVVFVAVMVGESEDPCA